MVEEQYQIKTYNENDPQNRLRGKELTDVVKLLYSTFNEKYKGQYSPKDILEWIIGNKNIKSKYQPIENNEVIVVRDTKNNKIVGVLISVDYRGVRYIPFLAISPEYRKKGIGTKLIELVKQKLNEDKELWSHHRITTRGFFEKNDFHSAYTGQNYIPKPKGPIYRAIWKKPK
jgi:ribosomal protein S18 acetylase RimI-like enzyme